MRFNKKGLFAILGIAGFIGVIINDLIQIINGGSYTLLGLATLFVAFVIADESASYIEEKLNR